MDEKFTQIKLHTFLTHHYYWLKSLRGEKGIPDGTTIERLNIKNSDLSLNKSLDISKFPDQLKDFECAELSGSSFKEQNLGDVNFKNANLFDCDFEEADLSKTKGLSINQLGGVNLRNAKLPNNITDDDFDNRINRIEEASKFARKVFIGVLITCLYVILIAMTTSDIELLTKSARLTLPIIGGEIRVYIYYSITPFIVLVAYLYFNIYLQRIWESISQLPAIMRDGSTLDERIDPWLIIGLARINIPKLKNRYLPFFRSYQAPLVMFLIWAVVPITLFVHWGRYLYAHDILITIIHVLAILLSALIAFFFINAFKRTLNGCKDTIKGSNLILGKSKRARLKYLTIFSIVLLLVSYFAAGQRAISKNINTKSTSLKADFKNKDISIKPKNWVIKPDIAHIRGADLRNRNLNYVKAKRAFLVNADFKNTSLYDGDLTYADLRGARIHLTDFTKASLVRANFKYARITDSKFIDSILKYTNFEESELEGLDLSGSDIRYINIKKATLKNIRCFDCAIRGVDFTNSEYNNLNFNKSGIQRVKFDDSRIVDSKFIRATLKEVSFKNTKFKNVNFSGANLANVIDFPCKFTKREIIIDNQTKMPKYCNK